MIILSASAVLLANFILYLAFGSWFTVRKGKEWSLAFTVAVGFFAYLALFAAFCLPIMFTYRPLSLLSHIWIVPCILVTLCSAIRYFKEWVNKGRELISDAKNNLPVYGLFAVITVISVILVAVTYNFTLDAAYYVANVSTNVDTDMINVYDAFTGSWQDHFELRYVFATYCTNDAVICQLTGLPALVQTKTVMSATVMLIVNGLYFMISRYFFEDRRSALLMYVFMTLINYMFISIYTASNFLMTRTYEGKTIVGNISIVLIFALFMMIVKDGVKKGDFLRLFIICLGTATVSSTANMVIPALVGVLFVPYALLSKKAGMILKLFLCILPEIVMMLLYVLYVKGYYAIYTFPR
ncbi:MAG: hypothetical protein K6F87_08590 [Lachnospiraceae bacterium]|nr:hypothetical protein [Lachnospiraceae bacterium]